MQLAKPKPPRLPRVHVQLVDGETRKGRTVTVYNTTVAEVEQFIRRNADAKPPKRSTSPDPSAA